MLYYEHDKGRQIVNLEMMLTNASKEIIMLRNLSERLLKLAYAKDLYEQYERSAQEFGLAQYDVDRVRRILSDAEQYCNN
jgi:hypothetical protein